jgi:hypothetical protein
MGIDPSHSGRDVLGSDTAGLVDRRLWARCLDDPTESPNSVDDSRAGSSALVDIWGTSCFVLFVWCSAVARIGMNSNFR